MICSSVNRLGFIGPSPSEVMDSTHFWRSFAGLRSGLFSVMRRSCCAPSHFSATVKRMIQARGQTLAFTNQLG